MWIKKAVKRRTKQLQKAIKNHLVHEFIMETEVFESARGDRRYEFTIAVGGPTERITIGRHKRVTYYHSWGVNKWGRERTYIVLPENLADVWLQLAEAK